MPLFRKYSEESSTIAIWKVEESVDELRALLSNFSFYEEGYARISSDKRKLEWLAVRVLLKELCGEEKEIAYHPSGKPYLADGDAFISISHTQGYVAVAYSKCHEVAVDIEQYGTRVKRVAHKFIREDEQVSIQTENEIYAMLLHWSAKETMFKLMDESGVDFREHLHIHPFVPSSEGVMEAEEYLTDRNQHFQISYLTHPEYVLTYTIKLS